MTLDQLLPGVMLIATLVLGGGGLWKMLALPRDNAAADIARQAAILTGLEQLNKQIGEDLQRVREERDELGLQVVKLRAEVARLTETVTRLEGHHA